MIKVLIVDDSVSARLSLRKAFERDHELLVVGEAAGGEDALQLCRRYDPDIVTLDLFLDGEGGLDVASTIMRTCPRPLVIVTSADPSTPWITYRAIERGALDVIAKLPGPNDPSYASRAQALLRSIKCLARVPVMHRDRGMTGVVERAARRSTGENGAPPLSRTQAVRTVTPRSITPRIALVGASTGGPPVVRGLLAALPRPLPVPLVVVQHISEGFAPGFAGWLGDVTGHPTSVISEARRLVPGRVYVAADGRDAVFESSSIVTPAQPEPLATICPSISRVFVGAAQIFGAAAVAVLLTGMGRDGADGLAALAAAGAQTAVQTPDSCVVPSMPESAIKAGATANVLSPSELGSWMAACLSRVSPRPQ